MKKILFAALMISMVGAWAATSDPIAFNVYNYQASIKRLNANYYIAVVDKAQTVADRYSVVNDTVRGYVVIQKCNVCSSDSNMKNFNNGDPNASTYAYAFLTRVGDTYHHTVFKVKATVTAGLFGAFAALNAKESETLGIAKPYLNSTYMNQAWMSLNFNMPTAKQTEDLALPTTKVLANVGAGDKPLAYGFYGLDNTNANLLQNAGFGTAVIDAEADSSTLGWCGNKPKSGHTCQTINSITGSTIGNPAYQGACGLTPMWDVCYDDTVASVKNAVVCGTWYLVLDSGLSGLADKDKDNAILARLGVKTYVDATK